MLFTHSLKDKGSFIGAVVLLLLAGAMVFAFMQKEPVMAPQPVSTEIANAKEIDLGGTKLNMVVQENKQSRDDGTPFSTYTYSFYTSDPGPKLLKKVESAIFHDPTQNDDPETEPFFHLQDITGNGVPEICILMVRSASNVSEYEILTLQDGSLENLTIDGQGGNLTWVNLDEAGYLDDHVWLSWHGSTSDLQMGRNYYKLKGTKLVFQKGVTFKVTNDSLTKGNGETCGVYVKNGNEAEEFVENMPCGGGTFRFDEYFTLSVKGA